MSLQQAHLLPVPLVPGYNTNQSQLRRTVQTGASGHRRVAVSEKGDRIFWHKAVAPAWDDHHRLGVDSIRTYANAINEFTTEPSGQSICAAAAAADVALASLFEAVYNEIPV